MIPTLLALCLTNILPAQADIRFASSRDGPYGAMFAARLTGEITASDAQALSAQIEQASTANMRQMQLDSIGGDLAAAFAIGRLMRKHQFDSLVLPDGQCDSACVFVLAAGIDKVVKGNVGIHRPYFSAISSEDVQTALQKVKAEAEAYLTEMNIPTRLVEEMFSTDPAEMRNLTRQELEAYRLNGLDYVVREQRAQQMAEEHGISREAYEAFRQELNHKCTIFTGLPEPMLLCVSQVAERHGIQL